jgi:protein ImuB
MRRVVSVHVPTWPTDRWRRRSGAAPDQPVLMAVRDGPRRVIHALDANAAALGLHTGMAVSQAQAMMPGLAILEAAPEADTAALTRLAAWCLRLSPLTAPNPPDGVWLDATGCAHLFGGEASLLRLIESRLHGAGIAARAAMADTPGCATARPPWCRQARPGQRFTLCQSKPCGWIRPPPPPCIASASIVSAN